MFTRPKIMGILNVTPDSFSDGGRYHRLEKAVEQGVLLAQQGADILDIGGESTRPGAEEISVEEEIRRTIPVIIALRAETKNWDQEPQISIDTRKSEVAQAAILAGADIWNDVSAMGFDSRSPALAADLACPVILMHAQGTPETMQDNPRYDNAVSDVITALKARIEVALEAGVERGNIWLDPGIGFGKTLAHNLSLFKGLNKLCELGFPVLMGASRKSFIGSIDGSPAGERLGGSIAAALWSATQGAAILRVHDVAETAQALKVWQEIKNG